MARVALVTIDYPPQRTSAAVQMRDLALEMKSQGHIPTIIVPTINQIDLWKIEVVNGIEVLRIRSKPTRDIGYVRRTINETMLAFRMIRGINKSPLVDVSWDMVAWYSPTIFFGPLILSMKRRSGASTYLILRDIFPEWAVDLGLFGKGPIYWYFRGVASLQYAAADTIGVQTGSNLSYMSKWAKGNGRKLEVLRNWQLPADDCGCSIDFSQTSLNGRHIFIYIGNMGMAQGMDILLDLAERLQFRDDVGFAFVGRGSDVGRLKAEVGRRRLNNVQFFDEIGSEEIPGLLKQGCTGLIALDPRHRSHNIPGKFLSYLMAGIPVLASVNRGTDLIRVINENNVGRAFSGSSLNEMVKFAKFICDDELARKEMGRNAKTLGSSMFSPSSTVRKMMSHLESKM